MHRHTPISLPPQRTPGNAALSHVQGIATPTYAVRSSTRARSILVAVIDRHPAGCTCGCGEEQHDVHALLFQTGARAPKLEKRLNASATATHDSLQHQTAIQFYSELYKQHRQHPSQSISLFNLPDSNTVANSCTPLAVALLLIAGVLLVQPQVALQLLTGFWDIPAETSALARCLARMTGLIYLFQGITSLLVYGCVINGDLRSTTCQRMLTATVLPIPGTILSIVKASGFCPQPLRLAGIAVVQLGLFCFHLLLQLHHQPWFLVKVLWPLAVTMIITECTPLFWTMKGGGPQPAEAVITALLSLKLVDRLTRMTARHAPVIAKRWLLLCIKWVVKYILPQVSAKLTKVLPSLARNCGRLASSFSRYGTKLAGRMAPRYAQDQLAGHTQHWAFPQSDGLLIDTVAKCIDLLPPKNPISWAYTGLLLVQLTMVLCAYAPELLFPPAVAAIITAGNTELQAGLANTAEIAVGAVLRVFKFSWGAGFFVSAFACNCLKTAADRGHLGKTVNRQLNLAVALLQAGSAVVLLLGMGSGAVVFKTLVWVLVAAAVAGAVLCITQATAAGMEQQQFLKLAGTAVGSYTPTGSSTGSAISSMHVQPEAQQGQSHHCSTDSTLPAANKSLVHFTQPPPSEASTNLAATYFYPKLYGSTAQRKLQEEDNTYQPCGREAYSIPHAPLSSVECEAVERGDPHYAVVTNATCVLLTLLQLAL